MRLPLRRPALGGLVLAFACLAYVVFFTQELPFYFEDLEWIGDGTPLFELVTRTLDPRHHGAFERPFELVSLRLLKELCGYEPGCFRAFKIVSLVGVVWLL